MNDENVLIETMPDEEVFALATMQMPVEQQGELSDLLAGNEEGELSAEEHVRLDDLMQIYRSGLARKEQAIKVAVERGLMPPLGQ